MKTTEAFEQEIKKYLDERAANDSLFAATYAKEGKSIKDCITYILNTVQQSGCNGFADAEIYSMAVHYYDEDIVDIGKAIDYKVVVNHTVELTEEEKEQARKNALQKAQDEAYAQLTKQRETPKRVTTPTQQPQPSLFEF